MKLDCLLLVLILTATTAAAHGTADNHLQLVIIGDRVKMNIVVDMRVLDLADVDGDGYASLEELAAESRRIDAWIDESFRVTDGDGNAGVVVFADVTSDLDVARANGDRVDHARILRTVEFPAAVQRLRIDVAQLALAVPDLRVTVIDAVSGKRYRLENPLKAQTVALRFGAAP